MRRAAAVVVVIAAAAAPFAPAAATPPSQIAWWYMPKDGPAPDIIPGPPDAPADGLYLFEGLPSAPTASNPIAISAVRFKGKSAAPSSLRLKAASGSTFVGADVRACPAIGRWSPSASNPGAWPYRAKYSCDLAMAFGVASSDGTAMSWPLGATFESSPGSGEYDVVLVPYGAPFRVAVAKPGADAVEIEEPPPPPGPAVTEPPPAAVPEPEPVAAVQPALAFEPPAPAPPQPAVVAAPPVEPALPLATVPAATHEDRGARVAAFIVLAVMTAALFWLGSQPGRTPRALGAVRVAPSEPAAEAVRGIGRFARPRTTRPRRL